MCSKKEKKKKNAAKPVHGQKLDKYERFLRKIENRAVKTDILVEQLGIDHVSIRKKVTTRTSLFFRSQVEKPVYVKPTPTVCLAFSPPTMASSLNSSMATGGVCLPLRCRGSLAAAGAFFQRSSS